VVSSTYACCAPYFRDDKGRIFNERGMDELSASPRQVTLVRWLSHVGVVILIFFGYNVLFMLIISCILYMANDIGQVVLSERCGLRRRYDLCLSRRGHFIPRRGSMHIDTERKLVRP